MGADTCMLLLLPLLLLLLFASLLLYFSPSKYLFPSSPIALLFLCGIFFSMKMYPFSLCSFCSEASLDAFNSSIGSASPIFLLLSCVFLPLYNASFFFYCHPLLISIFGWMLQFWCEIDFFDNFHHSTFVCYLYVFLQENSLFRAHCLSVLFSWRWAWSL